VSARKALHPIAISKGIGRYLEELEQGRNGTSAITLGPGWRTSDPDEIEARANELVVEMAQEPSVIKRLKMTQRARDLLDHADRLRGEPDEDARAFFIEHAAAWAEANGISYGAFRDMGVPAAVLKEAGISR
jgi:hypothetical protein